MILYFFIFLGYTQTISYTIKYHRKMKGKRGYIIQYTQHLISRWLSVLPSSVFALWMFYFRSIISFLTCSPAQKIAGVFVWLHWKRDCVYEYGLTPPPLPEATHKVLCRECNIISVTSLVSPFPPTKPEVHTCSGWCSVIGFAQLFCLWKNTTATATMSSPSELTKDNHKLLRMITRPNAMYNICISVFGISCSSFDFVYFCVVCGFLMCCEQNWI